MRRILLSPGWLARHALMVLIVVAFSFLGRWQWGRAMSADGGFQNLFYAVEWWSFAAIIVFGWWRMMRDDLAPGESTADDEAHVTATLATLPGPRPGSSPPGAPRSTTDAVTALVDGGAADVADAADAVDEELAAYNRYLAWRNANPRR